MKRSNFAALVLGTVSGVLFALGMCMALLPEWNAFKPGIIFGCAGLLLGLITVIIWRRMEGKQPVKLSGKAILTAGGRYDRRACAWRRHVFLHGMGQDGAGYHHRFGWYCRSALSDSVDQGHKITGYVSESERKCACKTNTGKSA